MGYVDNYTPFTYYSGCTTKFPEGSFLVPKMSKQILLAALLVVSGTLKVGVMHGAVEPTAQPDYATAAVAASPINPHKWVEVTATAYSSRVEETDDTPFITASGTHVHEGTLAANWLPIGTKVKIPTLFGNQTFTVEDRMNKRHTGKSVDIWFNDTQKALQFGVANTRIEIL
jgi:3D (Asp-Asp-Asp) domain-containing protein